MEQQKGKEGYKSTQRKNRKGRGSHNNKNRDSFRKGKDEEVMDKRPGGNDPRWWGTTDYVNAVAQFNFSSPLGKPIPYDFYNDVGSNAPFSLAADGLPTVPGIAAIDILPTIGIARAAVDPINTYVRSFYSKLRSTNNQNAPYQAPDLGMYILAIDSVHMVLEQLIRMYGIARTYSPMNRYMPNALLNAMGVNPDDATYGLYANLADFRAQIINLMIKIQTLSIPKGINISERHREIVKYVYKDNESIKAQMYLFRTPYLYKYDELYSEHGGGLKAVPTPIGQSAAKWVTFAHDLIDQITTSSFFAIVTGDIIKSFGYENLYYMPFLDETYTVVPVYNPEILLEIHNLKIAGDRWDDTAFDVTQDADTNSLIAAPYTGSTGVYPIAGAVNPIIDIPVDNPTPDMVMIATRLTNVGGMGFTDGKYKYVPSSLGTEMVTRITIYAYNANGVLSSVFSSTGMMPKTVVGINNVMIQGSFFDWFPHIYMLDVNTTTHAVQLETVISELSNYTVMNAGDLSKLHEMAVYGALTVNGLDTVGLKK